MNHDEFIQYFLANHPLCILEEAERAWEESQFQKNLDESIEADAFPNK